MESNNNYVVMVIIDWHRELALHTLSHLVIYSLMKTLNHAWSLALETKSWSVDLDNKFRLHQSQYKLKCRVSALPWT